MAVSDILEVRIVTGTDVQIGVNVRHYRVSAEVGPVPTYTQVASALTAIWLPRYIALMSTSATYRGVGVKRIHPLPVTTEGQSVVGTTTGLVAGDPLPRQVSGIITLRTGFAGRKFRGRVYIPFPAESDSGANTRPIGAYVLGLNVLATDFTNTQVIPNGAGSMTLVPVIWHRRTRTTDDITTATGRTVWATQRRRGDYGGQNPFFPF